MPWDNADWDWGWFFVTAGIWIADMVGSWYLMNSMLRHQLGAEKMDKIRRSTPAWKRFFHIGYSKYLHEHVFAFFVMQCKFDLMFVMLCLLPMECSGGYFHIVTQVYFFGAVALFFIDMVVAQCTDDDDDEKDANGEYAVLVEGRMELERTWNRYHEKELRWQEIRNQRKKRIRWLNRMEVNCWQIEQAMREYYQYYEVLDDKTLEQRDKDIQKLYDCYCELDRRFAAEGKGDYTTLEYSDLFPSSRKFEQIYANVKQEFSQAQPREKPGWVTGMLGIVSDFSSKTADQYIANQNIGHDNRADFDEVVEVIFKAMDEIEEFQREVHDPDIDSGIASLYDAMHANGLLPKERENRFPERMREGEIHRIYEYDS